MLENGEDHYADVVVSNADVKRTFLQLVDEGNSPLTSCAASGISRLGARPAS